MKTKLELSIVMPCLNEAETLEICIKKAKDFLKREAIHGEVIIADNGSNDGSQDIALKNEATLIHATEKGYGAALYEGISNANGKFVIMGDADDSYDFSNLLPFIDKLRDGYDLVMGNRFKGGIKKGAMPFLHKYLGNPVLSFLGKLFFKIKVNDFHCGLRGFSKAAFKEMNLFTKGMEFASEMVVKAKLHDMKITEVPTTLSPDGRSRPPHLNTWRDGWRHLRFLLVFSPKWLFLYPGILLCLISAFIAIPLFKSSIGIKEIVLDLNTLIVSLFTFLIGFQLLFFHFFTKVYAVTSGMIPRDKAFDKIFTIFNLERGLILGLFTLLFGVGLLIYNTSFWIGSGFSDLEPTIYVRKILMGVMPCILGIQIIIFSFLFSIIGIRGIMHRK